MEDYWTEEYNDQEQEEGDQHSRDERPDFEQVFGVSEKHMKWLCRGHRRPGNNKDGTAVGQSSSDGNNKDGINGGGGGPGQRNPE